MFYTIIQKDATVFCNRDNTRNLLRDDYLGIIKLIVFLPPNTFVFDVSRFADRITHPNTAGLLIYMTVNTRSQTVWCLVCIV